MSLDERTVSAMEQMVAAFDHIRVAVPALSGLRGMVANMRIHVHEARMLLVEPEAPVVHAEDPPKIEDIHGSDPLNQLAVTERTAVLLEEDPSLKPHLAPEPDHGDPPPKPKRAKS